MKQIILLLLFFASTIQLLSAQLDTLLIDFGNIPSPPPWHNVTDVNDGQLNNISNTNGWPTPVDLDVTLPFSGINTVGTDNPPDSLGYPATATQDNFYGNKVLFANVIRDTTQLTLSDLDPAQPYTLHLYASRLASDNRETRYEVRGLTTDTLWLNVANNVGRELMTTLYPDTAGHIVIELTTGEQNNNSFGFFYLSALKIVFENAHMANPYLSILQPDGGEYWQVDATTTIRWEGQVNRPQILEYSTNNGQSWMPIDTVNGAYRSYDWQVPDDPSTEALVRVRSDTLMDQSAGTFEIGTDTSSCTIVVLGSSTAAGAGTSSGDSAWVNRYRYQLRQQDTRMQVVNLARGGYSTWQLLPTGTPIPAGISAMIDTTRNITRALQLDPIAVIINLPSNDAAGRNPTSVQMDNFAKMAAAADSAGVGFWLCTTQPRNFNDSLRLVIQVEARDAIRAIYGSYAIDFWTGLADSMGHVLPYYNSGDGVHLNDRGHRLLVQRVLAAQVDSLCRHDPVGIESEVVARSPAIRVYPNPMRSDLHTELDLPTGAEVMLEVMDLSGKVLWRERQYSPTGGWQRLDWQPRLDDMLRLYLARLIVRDGQRQQAITFKFVKQH